MENNGRQLVRMMARAKLKPLPSLINRKYKLNNMTVSYSILNMCNEMNKIYAVPESIILFQKVLLGNLQRVIWQKIVMRHSWNGFQN